jgi:diacylglycerol kinase (ATP)
MKVALLLNAAAGSVDAEGALAEAQARKLGWDVYKLGDDRGRRTARSVAEDGYEMVIAGGGDGTVREVVQGLTDAARDAVFGVLPLGTGNDLARALRMPLEIELAIDTLARAHAEQRIAPMDVLELTHGRTTSVCANSVNGGLAPLIREQMSSDLKAKLGPLAFVWGALSSITQITRWPVRYRVDGGAIRETNCVAFVVANGGSVGGGVQVAPVAKLEDGIFDLVIIHGHASLADLTLAAVQAKFGDLFNNDCVEHIPGRELEIIDQPHDLAFTADGDTLDEPLHAVRVLPGALRAVVGGDGKS